LRYKGNAISRIDPSPMVKIIKEVKGEKAAKEVDTHKDIQLEAAIKFLNTPTQKNTPSPKK